VGEYLAAYALPWLNNL